MEDSLYPLVITRAFHVPGQAGDEEAALATAKDLHKLMRAQGWPFFFHHSYRMAFNGCFFFVRDSTLPPGQDVVACSVVYPQGANSAAIGPTITLEAYRRRGLATQLLDADVAFAKSLPEHQRTQSLILHASPFGNPVYRKYGFRVVAAFSTYDAVDLRPSPSLLQKIQDSVPIGDPPDALDNVPEMQMPRPPTHDLPDGLELVEGSDSISPALWRGFVTLANETSDLDRSVSAEIILLASHWSSSSSPVADTPYALAPGTTWAALVRPSADGTAQPVAFGFLRQKPGMWQMYPLLASSAEQANLLCDSLLSRLYRLLQSTPHIKPPPPSSDGSTPSATPSEDPSILYSKVTIDLYRPSDSTGGLVRHLTDQWGFEYKYDWESFEYLLDDAARERGDKGPTERLYDEVQMGKREGRTKPFTFLDPSMV